MSDVFIPASCILEFAQFLERYGWITETPEGEQVFIAGRPNMKTKIVLWKYGDEGQVISAWSRGELRTFLKMYPEG